MKFVVTGVGLTEGGGITGTSGLLSSLAKQNGHEFVLLLPDLPEYAALKGTNLKIVLQRKPQSLFRRYAFINRVVPKICDDERADALLCLDSLGPRHLSRPVVLFLQNAYYVSKEPVSLSRATPREKLKIMYGWHYFQHLPESVTVIVQTAIMKRHLVSESGLDPSRVVVIPDAATFPPLSSLPSPLARHETSRLFTFLCMAAYSGHKNLEILVEAMKKLPAYSRRAARCLLTIHPDQHPRAKNLLARISQEKLSEVVVNLGPVPITRLEEAYRSADAFILPTLLESFGRPYLEAMHFSLPILTSDRDFAHDRCRDAAVYFDPLEADSVAKSMARIMEDSNLRFSLTEIGKLVLRQAPTWDEVAARFLAVLEEAVS